MLFNEFEPYFILLAVLLVVLLAAIGMVAGVAIAHLSNDSLVFVFGVLHAVLASISFLVFLTVVGLELGIRCVVEPLCGVRAQVTAPAAGPDTMADIESGPDPRPRYPWNPNGSPTIGFPFREPQLIITETGLPHDWDRPDNVQPIRRALAEMQAEGVIGATPEDDTENEARPSRGTQTTVRDGGRFPKYERMTGDMAPLRFWWVLVQEQRRQELARLESESGRWSW